jgi:hypothetical protein
VLLLLPPSETKRAGGSGAPLDLSRLALPGLRAPREAVLDALQGLSADAATAARVLGLSARQLPEIEVNSAVRSSPTMPAIDRYTGVLFDALDAASLDAPARRWLGSHALIHTAPLGPVGALDRIPAYRLGAAVSLPGAPSLRRTWASAVTSVLSETAPRFVVDLRSEAYVALGPVPESLRSTYVRVVSAGPDGTVRALNHFNKHAKGALARALAVSRPRIASVRAFHEWADRQRLVTRDGAPGEVELFA